MRPSTRAQLLGTVSLLVLIGTASAEPVTGTRPPVAAVAANWAGPYVGLNLGVGWHDFSFNDVNNALLQPFGGAGAPFVINNEFFSGNQAGFTIGGQAGYNWQRGRWVYGVEADLNWFDARVSLNVVLPNPGAGTVVTASTQMDWLATFRGRVGVTMSPTLIYLTGGLAVASIRDEYNASFFTTNGQPPVVSDNVRVGYAIGGGVERMFDSNWTGRIEVMHVGFAKETHSVVRFNNVYNSEFKHSAVLLRFGLNRKLAPPPPP